eukprot:SAG31_NODE_16863_length_692_cov_1.691400_1_plen_24_part_01
MRATASIAAKFSTAMEALGCTKFS